MVQNSGEFALKWSLFEYGSFRCNSLRVAKGDGIPDGFTFIMIRNRWLRGGLGLLPGACFSSGGSGNGKPRAMKPFDPVEHGLKNDFVLTNFTKMKG
jgi:hypothetical protein